MITTTNTASPTRRIRRLRRAAGTLLASSLIVLGAAACEPTGCQLDCITGVALNPGATHATITTNVPTTGKLELFKNSAMTQLVAKQTTSATATTYTVPVGQLASATTYWWRLTATDANGFGRTETGSIRTFTRKVTVTIKRLHVIDDSDDFGTGELHFHLKVNDAAFTSVYVNGDLGSGTDLKNLSISRTNPNTTSALSIKVEGQDDDCDFGELCPGGTGPTWTSGVSSDMDWSTASFGPTTLPAQNGSGTWSAKTTAYALDFEVSGTWSVSYSAY